MKEFGVLVFVVLLIGGMFVWLRHVSGVIDKGETDDDGNLTPPSPRPTATELLSSLPGIYYGLAILCGVVLIGFTIANSDELSSTEIGAWVGYTVGAVLSMFAVGRVIELLQQIRDAVRNIPALSPGRSDVE